MNVPRNYSNDFDHRKQFRGLDSRLLPNGSIADAGKIAKIDETGKWTLANDENTIIVGNPDEPASVELENLKIGNTVYAVNEPHFEVIKGFRITIADGGQYRTDKPKIEFYDDAGIVASIPSSSYTASCDKEYAGNINMENVCSVATTDAPATFTYEFNDDFSITNYHLIKFTNAGSFAGDIAKNISLELTSDGENWIEIWSDIGLSWTTSGAYKIIDLNSGEESETILPIVTTSDNGKVLGVVGGKWDKTSTPTSFKAYYVGYGGTYISLSDGKTIRDIQNDINNGIMCYLIEKSGNTLDRIYYIVHNMGTAGTTFTAFTIDHLTGTLKVYRTNSASGNRLDLVT